MISRINPPHIKTNKILLHKKVLLSKKLQAQLLLKTEIPSNKKIYNHNHSLKTQEKETSNNNTT